MGKIKKALLVGWLIGSTIILNVSTVSAIEYEGTDDLSNTQVIENISIEENNTKKLANEDLGSGIFGTVPWRIDSDGVLHLGPGNLDSGASPWISGKYASKIKKIVFEGPVKAEKNTTYLFYPLFLVTEIVGLTYLDTSNMTDMNNMFLGLSVTSLDLSNFDTSNVTNMNDMFASLDNLTSLDVSNFDTSNVTDMSFMFNKSYNLTSLDLSNFDTSKVTTMKGMFSDAKGLTSLNLSSFDTTEVTDMLSMFYGLNSLTSLDVSNFDTSKVTHMFYMFYGLNSLTSLDVSNFDTSKVTNMYGMFYGLTSLTSLDLSSFDTNKVTTMENMFYSTNLEHIKLGEYFKFSSDSSLNNPPSTEIYTGKWANERTKEALSVDELTDKYDGSTMYGDWHWERVQDKSSINANNSTLHVGENWNSEDNFESATDKNGLPLTFENINVIGSVDTSTAGVYPVSYVNGSTQSDIEVTVKENKTSIKANDSTLYVGENWNPKDNFESATDKNGLPLTFENINVIGSVDTSTAGVYPISYVNGSTQSDIEVTVKENKTSIKANDSILYVGENWNPKDNFDSATDKIGNVLKFEDITLVGSVDTNKAGTYPIRYVNGPVQSDVTITVKEKPITLPELTLTAKNKIQYIKESQVSEKQFLKDIQAKLNGPGIITSNFEQEVNLNKIGEFEVTLNWSNTRIVNTNSFKVTVSVIEKDTIKEDDTEQSNQTDSISNKDATTNHNYPSTLEDTKDTSTKTNENTVLPSTGERQMPTILALLLVIVAQVLLKLKRKNVTL